MQPHSRQYYTLVIILGILTAFGPLSIDMYLPALPSIARDMGVDASYIQMSLASFFIGMSLGQIFYGPVADRYGRKKPLYIGLCIYILASAACAMSKDAHGLIIFRFFQAIGGCAGGVIARAVVRDLFDHKQATQVFSLQMLVMGVAPILAPIGGSYILEFSDWRTIFWLLTGLATLCLLIAATALPETRGEDKSVRFSRVFHTYVDIAKRREFIGYTLVGGFGAAGMFAYITGSSFVFIELFGLSARHYSWIFGSNAFGLIGMSQVNAYLLRRGHEPEKLLNVALSIQSAAGIALAAMALIKPMIATILPPLFVFIAMMGIIFPASAAGALQHEKTRAGAASALIGMLQFTISTIVAGIVSLLPAQSALPMAAVIACCGLASFSFYRAFGFGKNTIKQPLPTELPLVSD